MIANAYRKHPLVAVHLTLVAILLIGLVQRTGIGHLHLIALYLTVLLAVHAWLPVPSGRALANWSGSVKVPQQLVLYGVIALTLAIAGIHWCTLGHVPIIEAMGRTDDLDVQRIRLEMNTTIPSWLNYASHFLIKAFVPFTLVCCHRQYPRSTFLLALAAALYAISLLQKSYVITLFVPLWMAFLMARRWVAFASLTGGFMAALSLLMLVANPEKLQQARADASASDPSAVVADEGVKRHGLVLDLIGGVSRRILLMPGWTVAAWFEYIPADVPFQRGSAVRPLAAVLGREYVALDRRIYDLEYPEYAAKGTQGTMGSASFMYGWANFGWWGLALSGVLTAVVLRLVGTVFQDRWKWAICLNTYPLLMLTSVALPTVALSHGWALVLLLYHFVLPDDRTEP